MKEVLQKYGCGIWYRKNKDKLINYTSSSGVTSGLLK
jgi:hypothetical protein